MRHIIGCILLIGSAIAGAAFGEETPMTTSEIARLKEMYLETTLVSEGKPTCVIVVPNDPTYRPLAEKLAEALRTTYGAAPPIEPADAVARALPPNTHLIAMGVFANNPVVENLYLREFVLCDYNWPGGNESYVIRTVHNPWLNGKNVIYLGSTTLSGCQAAVKRFLEIVAQHPKGAVGPIIEVVKDGQRPDPPTEKEIAALEREIEQATSQNTIYRMLAQTANNYFITGHAPWARLFLKAMRRIDALHQAQPDVATAADCQYLFHWWDCIEEGPAFTDEERLEITRLLYRFAARLPEAKTVRAPLKQSVGNRVMTPAFAALYFARYYPDLELSRTLLADQEAMYEPDMISWKPPEDCPYYAKLTMVRSIRWALCRPDPRYIENRLLAKIADYYMLISNNLGQASGFGDYSGLGSTGSLVEALPLAAWIYKDGRYLWWWDHFSKEPTAAPSTFYRHRGQGLMGWVPPAVLPRKRPDDLLGIARAPLDRWIYERRNIAEFLGKPYEETRPFPIEECFDKVAFRAGFEPGDQYLCLSGFGWGYHSHPHANAIVNYSDQGQTMLYDDGYMVAQPSEHNTVIVLKEGWMGGIPELAQVRAQADFPGMGLFVSRLHDYSSVDWDRCLIWPKSRYFLVIDHLTAREAGRYVFQCIWRALGKTDLQGRHWVSENPPGRFHLIACSDAALTQKPSAGLNLNAPPFPPDKARRLVQSASANLGPGEHYQFANLFYSTPIAETARPVDVVRLGRSNSYLVEDSGQVALAGMGKSEAIPDLRIEAQAFHLLPDVLSAAGLQRVAVGAPLLSASVPVNVQVNLRTGEATVETSAPAEVTFTAGEGAEQRVRLPAGRHALRVRPVPTGRLAEMARALRTAFARASAALPAAEKPTTGQGRTLRPLWEYRPAEPVLATAGGSPHPNRVRVVDLDGDGQSEVVVAGMDGAIHALTQDGRLLWRHALPAIANDMAVSTTGGKGRVLVACTDNSVRALRADGTLEWSVVPPPKSYARPGYREGDLEVHQGVPIVVLATDINGDGHDEVIVGVHNGFVYAYDDAGNLLWSTVSHTPHSMTCGAACDLDGDGKKELVMGNVYAYAQILNADGRVVGRAGGSGHAGATVALCADLDGDGLGETAVGDKLGKIWLQKVVKQGERLASQDLRIYDTGGDITALALGDVDGDGKMEIAATSRNFLLYLFSADRQPRWHVNLGDVGLDLDLADVNGDGQPEILCGCEDGSVKVLDGNGTEIAGYQAGAPVRSVRVCPLRGEAPRILIGCEDGSVHALHFERGQTAR